MRELDPEIDDMDFSIRIVARPSKECLLSWNNIEAGECTVKVEKIRGIWYFLSAFNVMVCLFIVGFVPGIL